MDFFTLQDKARKQTRLLALLFLVAVIMIVLAINLVFMLVIKFQAPAGYGLREWLAQPYWIYITLATVVVILITSLFRSWQLKAKPDAIARMVNATPVSLHHASAQERRLVNVVEEMSIASGVPMPKIFIMKHESGINAFVAGLSPDDITLVVTQGLLDNLSRHELQGVIGHEYSHIFHGDMRINVRLIGILAGILVIGQLGHILLRSGSSSRTSLTGRRRGGNASAILILGVGLLAIGYIGLFFGRLIKAAISRQREFLADASALQYTRDKQGICNALYKIAQHSNGALLDSDKAEEMSHMCFGQSVKMQLAGWLATHPPIEKRITALDPNFRYAKVESKTKSRQQQQSTDQFDSPVSSFAQSVEVDSDSLSIADNQRAIVDKLPRQGIIEQVGNFKPEHLASAHHQLSQIPELLLSIARSESTQATESDLILALLVAVQRSKSELKAAASLCEIKNHTIVDSLSQKLASLNFKQQHALFDIALARLVEQDTHSKRRLIALLSRLVSQKDNSDLSEFMIYASCARRVLEKTGKQKSISRFKNISAEIGQFISLLYAQSNIPQSSKENQFIRQMKSMGVQSQLSDPSQLSMQNLARSLNQISRLHPMLKRDFISLCLDIVEDDGQINQKEYELLRLLGEYLGCPFPIALD